MLEDTLQQFHPAGPLLLAAAVLLSLGLWWLRRRKRPLTLASVARQIAFAWEKDLVIPDGAGGETHLDHLMLTARGLVLLDVKDVSGNVFCSERMEDWTVIDGDRRFTFRNPMGQVYDKVAAVRRHVQDIPVTGLVVFTARAEFTKGRPANVVNLEELVQQYAADGRTDQLREAFQPSWERLVGQGRPAR